MLSGAKHFSVQYLTIISTKLSASDTMRKVLLRCLFYRKSQVLCNLPKFIWLVNGRARSKLRQADPAGCAVQYFTIVSLRGPHWAKIKIKVLKEWIHDKSGNNGGSQLHNIT